MTDREELPAGVLLEVRNSTRYYVDQCVTLTTKDPEYPELAFEVTVTGSVSSYEPKPTTPRLHFSSHATQSTRKQWELVKRLGDQAWDEYEKRFPVSSKE